MQHRPLLLHCSNIAATLLQCNNNGLCCMGVRIFFSFYKRLLFLSAWLRSETSFDIYLELDGKGKGVIKVLLSINSKLNAEKSYD